MMKLSDRRPNQRTSGKILMFAAIALSATVAITTTAHARIDVRTLTCQQAVNLVHQQGSIVLTLTNNTYDKIVRNRQQCAWGESARNVYTQTLDAQRCLIGKRCVLYDPLGD